MLNYLTDWEKQNNKKIDFVLQVGDFQSARTEDDLNTMAIPKKHWKIGDFPLFYNGEKSFP